MNPKMIDISGKTSPYCLMVVAKEAKALRQSGELFITCDNFPAVTTFIPRIARDEGLSIETKKSPDGHWEIRLNRRYD
jgi:TusA-related sulfurtransferase